MKRTYTVKESTILLLSILAALTVIIGALFIYSNYQRTQFEYMESQSQTKSVLLQSQRIKTDLAQLEGRMKAISEMITASGLDPEGEWLQSYLLQTSQDDPLIYDAVYISMDQLSENLRRPDTPASSMDTYDTLMAGGKVFSKIIYSHRLGGYFFAIAEPVRAGRRTIGALRCTISAENLVQKESFSTLPLPEAQFITDGSGKVLFSYGQMDLNGENLVDFLQQEHSLSEQERNRMIRGLQGEYTISSSVGEYLVTSVSLSLHDWNLVQFSSKGGMQEISERLLLRSAALCLIIGAALAGLLLVMVRVIFKKNYNLELQQKRIASLATSFDVLLLEYMPDKDFMTLTPGDNCVYALDRLTIQNCRDYEFPYVHPDDRKAVQSFFCSPRADTFEVRLMGKDGQWLWAECQMQPSALGGKETSYAGKVFDIHRRKLRELKLQEENTKDALTGLMNRAALQEYMGLSLDGTTGGFLFMFDIDNFKEINDTHGHGAGDKILYQFSKVLRNAFRGTDPVGRIGGDEFAAYMMDTSSKKQAERKAKVILERLAVLSGQEGFQISASVGIAEYPAGGADYDELIHHADMAMYEAKAAGKNNYRFYAGQK